MADLELPEGSLLISVLRDGHRASCPAPETVLEAGDEVLAVLDPGLEEELNDVLRARTGRPARA